MIEIFKRHKDNQTVSLNGLKRLLLHASLKIESTADCNLILTNIYFN